MRATLRSRLFVSFVLVGTGMLLLSSAATWLLVRGSAQRLARDELREKVVRIQELTADLGERLSARGSDDSRREAKRDQLVGLSAILRGLQVTDTRLVFAAANGEILLGDDITRIGNTLAIREPELAALIALPDGVAETDLNGVALRAGEVIEGSHGNLVYRAQLLTGRTPADRNAPVVVLTGIADPEPQRRVLTAFLLAAAIALAVSVAVSAWLARRLSRPLAAAGATAAAIAAGDLTARVPVDPKGEAELATLTATINRMAADLERARGAERAFLMSVSHDLRTPLTSIRGYAEALADGTIDSADPAARARAAEVIAAEARRLERLVRDLLDLSRLDRREFSLHPRPCDAARIVHDTASGFAPKAAELGVALAICGDDEMAADLDAERLAQLVANLVENALKYAATSVMVEATRLDKVVVVSVSDDGPGIAETDAEQVFNRLHTVRSDPGRSVGTGLGLAIVRELAHAMGGDARVEPVATGGSRFVVRVSAGTNDR